MTNKNKLFLLASIVCLAIAGITVIHSANNNSLTTVDLHATEVHDANCQWNHYDAVMPSTSSHGSHEFWACCTHPGSAVLEKPVSTHITEQGAFTGTYFDNLASNDERYISQLETATSLDSIAPVTLSDGGLASSITMVPGTHKFMTYDFDSNKAIDLWFKVNYAVYSGDSYLYVYLFNNNDESGVIIRYIMTRTEDDGIMLLRTCANSGSSNTGTTFPSINNIYYFPRKSGIKSSENIVFHIAAWCINETNNTYRVQFSGGVEGGEQWYLNSSAEASTNVVSYYDVELGSDYFDGNTHRKVRFSSAANATPTISDYTPADNSLVYKDANGNVVGKLTSPTSSQVKFPTLKADNKKFVGWFDTDGNKMSDGDTISGKVIVTPRFINETGNDMFTLSDYGFDTDGKWLSRSAGTTEVISSNGVSTTGTSYDTYFVYQCTGIDDGDEYFIFGLPYDGIDANTRLFVRINENNNTSLAGYIYDSGKGTLGNAGADGTNYSSSGFRSNRSASLLIHANISNPGTNQIQIILEVTNLGTGATFQVTKTTTFSAAMGITSDYVSRNKLAFVRNILCANRVTDAF